MIDIELLVSDFCWIVPFCMIRKVPSGFFSTAPRLAM